ncbi:MAG TPA: AAA family ATPase, partial [Acidimicrobiales bacterium]|nr:AAA family ATPase [Acidimicrobiales bacterium]
MSHNVAALSSPVLVARTEELALLTSCLEARPSLAVVEGEAGVGKTRLVAELLAQPGLAGRRHLVGQCHPLREPFPLGPVIDALRGLGDTVAGMSLSPLAGALRPVLPELAPFLPPLPDPIAEPSMERHRLWRAVVELLGAVGPSVVVLEDLHWADEATAEFLAFLVVQLPPDLGLALTWRSEDMAPASPLLALSAHLPVTTTSGRVILAPLTPEQVQALVRAILASDQVSDEFAAYLHERTGGIPFAIEEVLRLLQDRHDLIRLEGGWSRRALDELQVPAAIRESILERLVRLPADGRRMMEAAAVVEVGADEDLLAAVAGLAGARSRAHAGLVTALESALLQATGDHQYRLRHALATEAIYAAIAAPSRRQLHQRAARALETNSDASLAQLARHYKEAGQPLKWGRYARAAAEHAAFLG